MLSRRHLRIRVMQALYSWYQSEEKNTDAVLRELFRGAERTYDLYLSLMQVLPELADEEGRYFADLPPRHLIKDDPAPGRADAHVNHVADRHIPGRLSVGTNRDAAGDVEDTCIGRRRRVQAAVRDARRVADVAAPNIEV